MNNEARNESQETNDSIAIQFELAPERKVYLFVKGLTRFLCPLLCF